MIDRLITRITEQNITLGKWILGFISVLFVRFLLESLSSPAPSGMLPSNLETLVHYGLFFSTAF
ncbi:MAG TPA: hypothetical protein VGC58_03020, partial [Candidatus Paceibacterota bacterium]